MARQSGTPCGRSAPDGSPGQTPATTAGARCRRHIASAQRSARPVGPASRLPHHTQGGRECVRGVVSSRGTTSAVPGGGASGYPQRAQRAAAVGWYGRGVCASGCPRAAGHGGGQASPHRVGGLRVFHPGRVAVRPRGRPGGSAGGAGVPEAGRRTQRAAPVLCAGRAAPWPLDAPSAWGVPCHTDCGQEVVQAAVVVVACADQPAPERGHPAWVWGPAPIPRTCAQAQARQADEGPPRRRGVVPMRPLTTHWSRRPIASAPASLRLSGAAHRGR